MTRTQHTLGILFVGWLVGPTDAVSAQSLDQHRFVVSANAGVQALSFTRTDILDFELYAESGSFRVTRTIGPNRVFDGGVAVRLSRRTGVGIAVSHVQGRISGTIDADVPHPFFFGFHRDARGTAPNLDHREVGVHLHGQFRIPLAGSLALTVSGGPTYFSVAHDLVTRIALAEKGFPFDEVDVVSDTTTEISTDALGYNVGVDLTYSLRDRIGVGFTARYSRGTSGFDLEGIRQAPVEMGGLHTVGGIRLGF